MNIPFTVRVMFDTFIYGCLKFYFVHSVLSKTFYILFTNNLKIIHVLCIDIGILILICKSSFLSPVIAICLAVHVSSSYTLFLNFQSPLNVP
jgi:hypothetical protein